MLLGVLSDTHGCFPIAVEAVALLQRLGATYFIHCGDIGAGVLDALPTGCSAFVFGNTDVDFHALARHAKERGIRCLGAGGLLDLNGVTIAVTHGDDPLRVQSYLDDPMVRYLFTGHTHVPNSRMDRAVRRVNPGALFRAAKKTVATVDLSNGAVMFHAMDQSG